MSGKPERIVTFALPYPPSCNHAWRRVGNRVIVSKEVRKFRERVQWIVRSQEVERFTGPLTVTVILAPPDNRKRDIDNPVKALLDALGKAGVYGDDSQIDSLVVKRVDPVPPHGETTVEIHSTE